jgi:hypothetical protein
MNIILVVKSVLSCFAILMVAIPIGVSNAQPVSYPLHTGDRWEYESFVLNAPWKVAQDTVMPNGKTYRTIISQGYPVGHVSLYWQFHRQQGNQIFSFDQITQQEILLFDFDANAGDTISVYPRQSGVGRVFLLAKRPDTLFGVGRRHWVFLHDLASDAVDEEIRLDVTDTLGITGFFNVFGPGGRIMGAVIDGRSYGTIVGVSRESSLIDASLQLERPFPNPFNPETRFTLQVKSSQSVVLKVYNVLGEEQATIWSGFLSPGAYVFKWDASTSAAGVYIVCAVSAHFQQTHKVVLLK